MADNLENLFLTERDLARIVKLSVRTLQRMRKEGALTSWFPVRRSIRYWRAETMQQISARRSKDLNGPANLGTSRPNGH